MLGVVEGDSEWVGGWEEERALVEKEIGHVGDVFRKDETTKMINTIEVCPSVRPRDWFS